MLAASAQDSDVGVGKARCITFPAWTLVDTCTDTFTSP